MTARLDGGIDISAVFLFFVQALGINANYAKALFRRGQAHNHLDEIDKAEADMRAVLALEPEGTIMDMDFAQP